MRSLFPTLRTRRDGPRLSKKSPSYRIAPNPHKHPKVRAGSFFSTDVGRLLQGWDQASQTVDYYLQTQLRQLRARSRDAVRANPFGKRFIQTIKSNVVGPMGVTVQAQSLFRGEPDKAANDAIERAFSDWCQNHCDYLGRHTFVDLQNLAIGCAAQDGEFLFHKRLENGQLRLKFIDAELLDVEKNDLARSGNEIRLGVEYSPEGRVVRYHFKRKTHPVAGGYDNYEKYSLPADSIIHGFISEWPDQSRGIPWMHASLERSKHLDKYDEAAIVNARSNAAAMGFLRSNPGDEPYEGDEQYGDDTLDQFEAGTIKDIGDRDFVSFDGKYPHQMYADFVKRQLQSIASGLGISYHSLSGDLEGVNYSSIRAGVLEDREIFKGLQNWFIRCFVRPVYEEWLSIEHAAGRIRIAPRGGGAPIRLGRPVEEYLPAHFQGRRWAWVDPQKDGYANQLAIQQRLKSRSQIIREQGDDPDEVFRACAQDEAKLKELGLTAIEVEEMPDEES